VKLFFITGATGFIGKKLLKAVNGEVRLLSRMKQSSYDTVICDLQSEIIPCDALNGVDTVIHLAGCAHDIRDEKIIKELYQKINVDATIALAKLALESGVKKFVFISSVKAGGVPLPGQCASEKDQSFPDGVYGETKREAELKLLEISKNSNMQVSIIRPSLVYGPNVKGNLKLMLSAIKKGWFPSLPETGNKRSMIHVDDLVRAILLVVKYNQKNGEIFIVTDGSFYSSHEIYNTMCQIVGRPEPKWSLPKIFFDFISLVNPSIKYKVNKLLGDEHYSSRKLEALGFKANRSLREMNETDF
tara:strand:+ start:1239 stop:2144 length:906 start_codon:yes stop_codon:yes gene_type:complete